MKTNINAYIKKYPKKFTGKKAGMVRNNHAHYSTRVRFVVEKEMPNESTVEYGGKTVNYSSLIHPCICVECDCESAYVCERKEHNCGECNQTCC